MMLEERKWGGGGGGLELGIKSVWVFLFCRYGPVCIKVVRKQQNTHIESLMSPFPQYDTHQKEHFWPVAAAVAWCIICLFFLFFFKAVRGSVQSATCSFTPSRPFFYRRRRHSTPGCRRYTRSHFTRFTHSSFFFFLRAVLRCQPTNKTLRSFCRGHFSFPDKATCNRTMLATQLPQRTEA